MTFEQFKREAINKFNKAYDWCYEHREALLIIVPAAISGVVGTADIITRTTRYKDEKRLKDRMIYDRQLGGYLETKKPLTNEQKVEISRRHQNGETVAEVLNDMGLLK